MNYEDWQTRAACIDLPSSWFFPRHGGTPTRALRVCARCPVRDECLEHALTTPEPWGVWGGKTPDERKLLRAQRARARKAAARTFATHNASSYSHGCRCDICTTAWRIRWREKHSKAGK